WLAGRLEMRERQPEPRRGVRAPDGRVVPSRIDVEDVRDARRAQLAVEQEVLAAEAGVSGADVEGEERRASFERRTQLPDERMRRRPRVRRGRPDVERARPRRVRRVEVAAPGLDDREGVEVVKREERRAVAAGGEADDRAAAAGSDRPE